MNHPTPLARASRLLAALQTLAGEEAIFLRAGRGSAALAAHMRAAPVLAAFLPLAADPAVAGALQPRLAAWLELRRAIREEARASRRRLLDEGHQIAAARQRLAGLVAAYPKPRPSASRLRAAV